MNKRETGSRYEAIAANYLTEHGYRILEQNYRNSFGEVDIIAEKNSVLIYIEIKYRSSSRYGDPLEAVDVRKQRRICKVAAYHYAQHGRREGRPCRFDVIGIYGDGRIEHIKNAFEYQSSYRD
ncbi:MAG: YraN family protein [Lachnospiraceae bacterium]|nr:YraN family protein [Lachnospiraceae bacterium]